MATRQELIGRITSASITRDRVDRNFANGSIDEDTYQRAYDAADGRILQASIELGRQEGIDALDVYENAEVMNRTEFERFVESRSDPAGVANYEVFQENQPPSPSATLNPMESRDPNGTPGTNAAYPGA